MATVTALLDLRVKPESVAVAKETVESVLVDPEATGERAGGDQHALDCLLGLGD